MIEVENISKRFGNFAALDQVSLRVAQGKLVALLGPSGSGKTTLLRILAGLEQPDDGRVRLGGVDATGLGTRDRRVGFVFQHYALFRHMSVADNIAFGLRVRKGADRPSKAAITEKVHTLLELVQLEGLAGRYPSQLSGGQRQRVALARALAVEPRLLLLDEPFGALDAQVRKDLRRWLRHLHDEMGLTGVFVTHDQEEALEVADEVVVMNKGRIEQIGTPSEIYDSPATPFVYRFLGNVNALPCRVAGGHAQLGGLHVGESRADGPGTAFVRPHDVEVLELSPDAPQARIRQVMVLGPVVRAELELPDGTILEAEVSRDIKDKLGLRRGLEVSVFLRKARVFVGENV
ncbi:Sulfate and thiosulfate import ATP-binding protein CysA [Paramagnetospirillum magnetotacticum MS-1]|uniref:Sulfate and thiosulfate import ATP-binding protein CysA n=1 Tax=Paramagnetospirillum magnetotacticum MS-1 TaxID=272627 RepID=A0A0C2YUY6_PARME|nr:sulfate/molybdate ABC transporter ATP-binding protein [Paramagnetospirillum magnetotacticum]KIL98510.1 Sulfate and thiosulfate import ATP-binding protein CysA [Paramagnetospirillum magnetotacticum MS-1]